MTDVKAADTWSALEIENDDLQNQLRGVSEEMQILRVELLAACIAESGALSSENHMRHYLGELHDRWADPSDVRSLEEVVQEWAGANQAALIVSADLERLGIETEALRDRLTDIERSRSYRFIGVYRRRLEHLLPAGTRRRAVYRLLV